MSAYRKYGMTMEKLTKYLFVMKRWTIIDTCFVSSKYTGSMEKNERSSTSDE